MTVEKPSLALWLIARHAATDVGSLQSWVHELEPFGQAHAVRAAIVSARAALPAWERAEPAEHAPHDRIAAAEAWLACPCETHAEAAGELAFANGDDNPLKGWSAIRIDGREIEDVRATYAHWSADSACSAAYSDFDPASSAGTAFAQAVEALDDGGLPRIERARRIADAISDALAPFATVRADGPSPSSVPTTFAYAGPALSDVARFASFARRVLAVLGASVDAVPTRITHDFRDGARVDRYRFASADGTSAHDSDTLEGAMTGSRTQDALPRRSTGEVVFVVLAYVFLALSAAWFLVTANLILTGGNDATCTDVAPDRHVGTVVAVSAAGYLVLVVPALLLLRKKRIEAAILALLLACLAVLEPCGGLGWIIFSIGMC